MAGGHFSNYKVAHRKTPGKLSARLNIRQEVSYEAIEKNPILPMKDNLLCSRQIINKQEMELYRKLTKLTLRFIEISQRNKLDQSKYRIILPRFSEKSCRIKKLLIKETHWM